MPIADALPCKRCGVGPVITCMQTGGTKIRCQSCGTEYWHHDYTVEQLVRIWNYRQKAGDEECESV